MTSLRSIYGSYILCIAVALLWLFSIVVIMLCTGVEIASRLKSWVQVLQRTKNNFCQKMRMILLIPSLAISSVCCYVVLWMLWMLLVLQ